MAGKFVRTRNLQRLRAIRRLVGYYEVPRLALLKLSAKSTHSLIGACPPKMNEIDKSLYFSILLHLRGCSVNMVTALFSS